MRLIICILLLFITSCGPQAAGEHKKATYLIARSSNGYGYAIFIEGKKIIDQPHLPGISTSKGFSDSTKAATVAAFVIHKIRNDQWPPSVSRRELDSLGVLD